MQRTSQESAELDHRMLSNLATVQVVIGVWTHQQRCGAVRRYSATVTPPNGWLGDSRCGIRDSKAARSASPHLGVQGAALVAPADLQLQLAGDLQQQVFLAVGGHQLNTDRQSGI